MEAILIDLQENFSVFELCVYMVVLACVLAGLVACFITIKRFIDEVASAREA